MMGGWRWYEKVGVAANVVLWSIVYARVVYLVATS